MSLTSLLSTFVRTSKIASRTAAVRRRMFFEPLEDRRVLVASISLGGAGGQAGALDPTFDTDGWATTHVNDELARDVVVDAGGRTIVVGKHNTGGQNDFIVARYDSAGQLDASFGVGGKVIIDLGGDDVAKGVALDGTRIVVAGQSTNTIDDNIDVAIVRLDSSGQLDATFGSGGKLVWDLDPTAAKSLDHVEDVAVLTGGSIVVVGQIVDTTTFEFDWHVSRVDSAGAPAGAFGTGGVRKIDFLAPAWEQAVGVAVQMIGVDERIVVAGFNDDGSGETIKVVRLLSGTGADDNSFGTFGQTTALVTGQAADVAALPNGNIFVAGTIHELGDNKIVVASFASGGAVNSGFGASGVAKLSKTTFDLVAADIVVDPTTENIVVAGTVSETSTFLVGRLTPGGAPDSGFGMAGLVEADLESSFSAEKARAVALDPLTGNIVVAGQRTKSPLADDIAVARFIAASGGQPPVFDGFEGEEFPLSGTFSDLTVGTHSIVIDWGDGETTIISPSTSSGSFDTAHTFADDSDLVKAKIVVTGPGTEIDCESVLAHINNRKPVPGSINGPGGGVRNQVLTFTGSFTDAGKLDTHTVIVEWGDGTSSPAAINAVTREFTAKHAYATTGNRSVSFSVNDDDDLIPVTVASPATIHVEVTQMQTDPCCPGEKVLAIGGTSAGESISVGPVTGGVEAFINSVSLGVFTGANAPAKIAVYAGGGDDDVQIAGSISLSAWLYGGEGKDRLKGGSGQDILLGDDGDDLLVGGSGRDILIGGAGADRIVGNADDDILIAGTTDHDGNAAALCAILDEWTSSRGAATRIANLEGCGTGERSNGGYFLKASMVHDDGARDVITGSSGFDWFFANLGSECDQTKDKITDLSAVEFASDLSFIGP